MHASEVTQEVVEHANELYWRSDRSVNGIAEELDLSKGALYGIIQGEPAGFDCPLCGDEVLYMNRTAKDRGQVDCPTCNWDGSAEESTGYDASSGDSDHGESADEVAVMTPPAPLVTARARTIVGGALLGAAAGLALVLWVRRR